MLIYFRSVVVVKHSSLALRSLKQQANWNMEKALLHSTGLCQRDDKKKAKNALKEASKTETKSESKNEPEKPSTKVSSSSAAEKKKKMLKAKFGQLEFIELENNIPTFARSSRQVELKPDVDYKSIVKTPKETAKEAPVEPEPKKKEGRLLKILNQKLKEQQKQEKIKPAETNVKPEKQVQQVQEDKKDKKAGLIGKISLQDLKYASDVASTSTQSTSSSTKSSNLYESFHKLNSGVGLSIFSQTKKSTSSTTSTQESVIWSMHQEEELKSAQEIPHLNGFEEMIKLTEEGKLWKFPIDNEQGIEEFEDAQTPFHEHIFLDHHLERFPDIEPIQQFMTLAINGLSKNGFISLKEKLEIIDWYHDYFSGKLDLINEALSAEQKEREFKESLRKAPS